MTLEGRILRLHFVCRAPLPIGSTLRVTGSTLWAPGSLTNQTSDPTDASSISHATRCEGLPDGGMGYDDWADGDHPESNTGRRASLLSSGRHLYASSVEMVTTPEEYPIWRTRRPVVVVVTSGEKRVWHHRYRYMVVTPGCEEDEEEDIGGGYVSGGEEEEEGGSGNVTTIDVEGVAMTGKSSTSNDLGGSFPVMMWEDPFKGSSSSQKSGGVTRSFSSSSLPSLKRVMEIKTLSNLPYRTMDIDLGQTTGGDDGEEMVVSMKGDEEEGVEYTENGVRIDVWNNGDDAAFNSYKEREESSNPSNQMDTESIHTSSSTSSLMDSSSSPTTPKQRLLLVCFHLPLKITRLTPTSPWTATWSESLLAKTEHGNVARTHDTHWVGTVSTGSEPLSDADQEEIRTLLKPMGCTPLFFDADMRAAHYMGMCKQVLWPAFHNVDLMELSHSSWGQQGTSSGIGSSGSIDDDDNNVAEDKKSGTIIESDWDQSRLDKWWNAYTSVNRAFANALSTILQPGDIMWVHDYHLSLLPQIIATGDTAQNNGRRTYKIVFFLHIPFPTSQIFRELECGEAILEGMLHADIVGFHAFDHARHFLNAAKRILGLNYENLVGGLIGVQYHSRKVLITMSNVSIEPDLCDAAMRAPRVADMATQWHQRHGERTIIAGVEIAQRLSGISLKLLAYERLLTDYPVWGSQTVMIQRCLVPGSRPMDERSTLREIRFLVRRIQENFGTHVIDYQEVVGSSLSMEERLAMWSVADVFMSTPIREGLNLLPLEYVYARKAPAHPGVTIASEFSAVSSILNGALRVNPFDIQLTASFLDKALTMEMQEKEGRHARDIDFVSSCRKDMWTKNVLRDLNEATMSVDESESGDKFGNDQADSTAAFLARESEQAFSHVDTEALISAYNSSKRRVIITDFNGTIVIKEPPGKYLKREILGSSGLKPPTQVIDALTRMAADPQNTVFVVSGDSQENVENALGHIPNLGLAASNGACFSLPSSSTPSQQHREWQYFDLGVDWAAVQKVALPVLSKYTARTNGSFVKLTKASIGWSYYSCDPEWGSLQASHLVLELEAELRSFDVRFVTLKGIVEIVPRRLNKGLIVQKVLREMVAQKDGVDFILCMGDDISDEKMFTAVFTFVAEMEMASGEGTAAGMTMMPSPPILDDEGKRRSVEDLPSMAIAPETTTSKMKTSGETMYCYTVAVGKKATHASQYVDDARDVANLLVGMTGGNTDGVERKMSWDTQETGVDFFA